MIEGFKSRLAQNRHRHCSTITPCFLQGFQSRLHRHYPKDGHSVHELRSLQIHARHYGPGRPK